ncbi:MAG: PD40 domain-containing protein [Sedimentisphaerales bacterium]|nr:PD40 domain-containing protein [Sedimentisphaerales bacterium]
MSNIKQFYHSAEKEIRDVIDMDSLLAYYDVESNSIKTSPVFSRKEYLETYPAWSPDGRFLYFSAAAIPWKNKNKIPPDNYKVKYDLMRVDYDIENDSWGQLETVVSSENTGLSALMPRISPDGKRLLFCMASYGSFPVYNETSDLYLLDLEKENSRPIRLSINSKESESWHCFSSNSRWIVFSSKRDYGVFTRLYISYIDEEGTAHKPFILPQKNPSFYESCLQTFNTPELIVGPVSASVDEIAGTIMSSQKLLVDMPITMATPKADGTSQSIPAGQRE